MRTHPDFSQWTLGEGNTPLVRAVRQAAPGKLLFKLESTNPTGSYKDRFTVAELQRILATRASTCVATSSGNTGSSLATYCARAGMHCTIVVNETAPEGKLQQMSAHGAAVLRVPGFVTDSGITQEVFTVLRNMGEMDGVPLVVSAFAYCPHGMEGVESIAAELLDVAPDHVFVPVGGGGLYSAIVQGFQKAGGKLPRVHAVQPSGCLTLVGAFLRGDDAIQIPESTTHISGLSVPSNLDASRGLALLKACGGQGIAVEDCEVFAAQQVMFLEEGIYCEPAGATAFAGWKKAIAAHVVGEDEVSICLVTGHGFKDPASAGRIATCTPVATVAHSALRDAVLASERSA